MQENKPPDTIWEAAIGAGGIRTTIEVKALIKGERVSIFCDPALPYINNDMLIVCQSDYDEVCIPLDHLDEVIELLIKARDLLYNV